jgi:Rrf2 family protein
MTSDEMAAKAACNPVVIRRVFAGLKTAGIVASVKGHGGGWSLRRPAAEITLAEVQAALGDRVLPIATTAECKGCLVERSVHFALSNAVAEANRILDTHLSRITLAQLLADVRRRDRAKK